MNNKRRLGSTAVKITVGGKEVIPERRRNINIIDHSSSSTSSTICGRDLQLVVDQSGKLDDDNNNNNVNGHCATNNNKIILSLHNEQYKSIMWKYFNVLGKTKTITKNISEEEREIREREREEVIGKEILAFFKQRQNGEVSSSSSSSVSNSTTTKFYKQRYKNGALEEVNENIALESKLYLLITYLLLYIYLYIYYIS